MHCYRWQPAPGALSPDPNLSLQHQLTDQKNSEGSHENSRLSLYLLPRDPEVWKELRTLNEFRVWQEAREQAETGRLPRLLRGPRWHTFQVLTKLVTSDRL